MWGYYTQPISAQALNSAICQNISGRPRMDHWAPQSNFIYDDNGRQIVKYVLHFETLITDLPNLLCQYSVPDFKLDVAENQSQGRFDVHLSVSDLEAQTIHMINKFYHDDFVNFGYEKR